MCVSRLSHRRDTGSTVELDSGLLYCMGGEKVPLAGGRTGHRHGK